ncbi:nucleoside hydrolase [Kiritimatiellota bacterium B12222]|nr:nucleoside hydrolase [Kiritimatiellota bacterium B12222]
MTSSPAQLILDTDMLTDCDDAGALAMLHALADLGEAHILAVAVNGMDTHGLHSAVVSAINTYFGRPDIPIGVSPRTAEEMPAKPSSYSPAIFEEFPHDGLRDAERSNAVNLYRRLLTEAEDHSITIVSIGFLSNIADLLATPSGRDLVARKVKGITIMGGAYPAGSEYNFNFQGVGATTKATIESWPTTVPMTFVGYELGELIITGKGYANMPSSPMKRAYEIAYYSILNGRPSWDQIAVLHGVRGLEHKDTLYFKAVHGENHITDEGSNSWTENKNSPHAYLELATEIDTLASAIETLMLATPQR